jgi:hypothetical protein
MTDPALEELLLFSNTSYRVGMATIGQDFYDAHSTVSRTGRKKNKRPVARKATVIFQQAANMTKEGRPVCNVLTSGKTGRSPWFGYGLNWLMGADSFNFPGL